MNIELYEERIRETFKNFEDIKPPVKKLLDRTLTEIKLLESIYMGEGAFKSRFSSKFENQAHEERQDKCLLSSACYKILRNNYKL